MKYSFDDANHVHLLEGRPLLGTTSVIKDVMPPFLAKWGAQCAVDWLKENKQDFTGAVMAWTKARDKAADKGTDMHADLEGYVLMCMEQNGGAPVELTKEDIWKESTFTFAKWSSEHVEKFLFSEGYTFSEELWVGGICDAGAKMKNGTIALIDFKSSKEAYFNQVVQVGGYARQIAEKGVFDANGSQLLPPMETQELIVVPFGSKKAKPKRVNAVDEYKSNFEICVELYKSLSNYQKGKIVWNKNK